MKVTDPVCGLEFDEELSVTHEHNSKKYHFCCDGCKKIFIKKPKKWSKKSRLMGNFPHILQNFESNLMS